MTPHEELSAALADLTDRGQRTPCQGPDRHLWTSDAAEEREAAAHRCGPCPVLAECAAYADDADERWHVWASVDRTRRTPRGRRAGRRNRRAAA